mgnify:FL=1
MADPGTMLYTTAYELEERFGSKKTEKLARESEYAFLQKVTDIAYEAAWNREIKAVFISGPTSSGKTTTSTRLGSAIHLYGRPTLTISLDDYYKEGDYDYDEDGRPDMESITTLDIDLMVTQFRQLLRGEEVILPRFDFGTRTRSFPEERRASIAQNAVMIVEGLHGLSDEVIGELPQDECMGVFLCPWASLVGDRTLLRPEQIRQLRRISRDHSHRQTGALATLDYWPIIHMAESRLFEAYLQRADYFINSVIPYEFFVIGTMAADYLEEDLKRLDAGEQLASPLTRDGHFADILAAREAAEHLIRVSRGLPRISPDMVPPMSILNEFI